MNEERTPLQKLSDPLGKADIELKIGTVSEGKGFSLLAYKTARTDIKRLNDAFGLHWKDEYFKDPTGQHCCKLSVYDAVLKEWVSRIDVGTESYSEKEKGLYSDAFKRAACKFGLGIELYKFPFIWIPWGEWNQVQGKRKATPRGFNQSNLVINEYLFENGEVKELTISHKGNVIYNLNNKPKKTEEQKQQNRTVSFREAKNISEITNFLNEDVKAQFSRLKFTSSTILEWWNWAKGDQGLLLNELKKQEG